MVIFFGFACILMIAVGIAGIAVVFQQTEEQRPKHLLRMAEATGMGFTEDGQTYLSTWQQRTPLFSAGHNADLHNVIYGPYRNIELSAFDYNFQYQEKWFKQTVLAIELKEKNIPRFCLWPMAHLKDSEILDRPEDAMELKIEGLKDKYQLYATSEGTIRQLLNPQAVAYLNAHPNYRIEGNGNYFAIYKLGKCCNPTQINHMMRDAHHLLHTLRLDDPEASFEPIADKDNAAQNVDAASSTQSH